MALFDANDGWGRLLGGRCIEGEDIGGSTRGFGEAQRLRINGDGAVLEEFFGAGKLGCLRKRCLRGNFGGGVGLILTYDFAE